MFKRLISRFLIIVLILGGAITALHGTSYAAGTLYGGVERDGGAAIPASELQFISYVGDTDDFIVTDRVTGSYNGATKTWIVDTNNFFAEGETETVNVGDAFKIEFVDTEFIPWQRNSDSDTVGAGAKSCGWTTVNIPSDTKNLLIINVGAGTVAGSGEVQLVWNVASPPPGATYRVYRNTADIGNFKRVATGLTEKLFRDTTVENGTTYYYMVAVFDSLGNFLAYSNFIQSLTPGPGESGIPRIDSILPDSGSTAGGIPVTISGANFDSGARVFIGNYECQGVSISPDGTEITATTVSGVSGTYDLKVINFGTSGKYSILFGAFTYVADTIITKIVGSINIDDYYPGTGKICQGQRAKIYGSYFGTSGTVTFQKVGGGITQGAVSMWTDTLISLPLPINVASGTVTVNSDQYDDATIDATVVPCVGVMGRPSDQNVARGDLVWVSGSGLGDIQGTSKIYFTQGTTTIEAVVDSWSNTQIWVYVPVASPLGFNYVYVNVGGVDSNISADWAAFYIYTYSKPDWISHYNVDENSAWINWAAVSGVPGYTVAYREVGAPSWTEVAWTGGFDAESNPQEQLTGLTPYTTYEVRAKVTGVGYNGSDWTWPDEFYTLKTPWVGHYGVTSTTVIAIWEEIFAATGGYTLQWSEDPDFASVLGAYEAAPSEVTYEVTGLASNTTYYLRVRAKRNGNTSDWSNIDSFYTLKTPWVAHYNVTSKEAMVIWEVVPAATSYTLQYGIDENFGTYTEITGLTAPPYGLILLTPSTTYYLRIKALNVGGESDWSNVDSFYTLSAPLWVEAYEVTPTSARIQWGEVTEALSYTLRYRIQGTETWTELSGLTAPWDDALNPNPNKQLASLVPDMIYEVQVKSVDATGSSDWAPVPALTFFTTTDPYISGVTPTSGYVGTTLMISGSNFGSTQGSSTITIGGVSANPAWWINNQICVAVPQGAVTGNIVIDVPGKPQTSYPFTVLTGPIVIDDYEGGDAYPYSDNSGGSSADFEIISGRIKERDKTLRVRYSNDSGSPAEWAVIGGVLLYPGLDLTGLDYISFYLKGDGSANTFKLVLIEDASRGSETWTSRDPISLSNTNWREIEIKRDSTGFERTAGSANGVLDGAIIQYQLLFVDGVATAPDAYLYLDYLTARNISQLRIRDLELSIVDPDVVLSWTDLDGEEGYNVYRSEDSPSGPWIKLNGTLPSGAIGYTDSGAYASLPSGRTYYYTVRAVEGGWEGPNSNIALVSKQEFTGTPVEPGEYWISLPYNNPYIGLKASDWMSDLPPEITEIARWDPVAGNWVSYLPTDFDIVKGEGYRIKVEGNTEIVIQGSNDLDFDFSTLLTASGTYLISLPYDLSLANAQAIVDSINGGPTPGTCVKITRWDFALTNSYESLTWKDAFGSWVGTNFAFIPGEGHQIDITGSTTWVPPVD